MSKNNYFVYNEISSPLHSALTTVDIVTSPWTFSPSMSGVADLFFANNHSNYLAMGNKQLCKH